MNIGEENFGEWLTIRQISQFFPYQNFPIYSMTHNTVTTIHGKYLVGKILTNHAGKVIGKEKFGKKLTVSAYAVYMFSVYL